MCEKERGESGAVLILALIFVIVTGVVGVALASLTSTNLTATSDLQAKRGVEYAADGAVDAAIQIVRYSGANFALGTWAPCAPSTQPLTMDGSTIWVECTMGTATAPTGGRTVEFQACGVDPVPTCTASDLTAQVTFDDNAVGGGPQVGTSVTIVSWNDSA